MTTPNLMKGARLPMAMELSSTERARLRSKATTLPASLNVGKGGLSDTFLEELRARLKKEHLVKVRMLEAGRAGEARGELARSMAEAVDAALVEVRGNTALLYRPRAGQGPPR